MSICSLIVSRLGFEGITFVLIVLFLVNTFLLLFVGNPEDWFSCHEAHYDNTPMQYTAIFHGCKNNNFQIKMIFFLIFA